MSSADERIIHSVDVVISAVGRLLGEISDAQNIDDEQKTIAVEKLGMVTENLQQINQLLFSETFLAYEDEANGEAEFVAASLEDDVEAVDDEVHDDIQVQDENVDSDETEELPRFVMTPVSETEDETDLEQSGSDEDTLDSFEAEHEQLEAAVEADDTEIDDTSDALLLAQGDVFAQDEVFDDVFSDFFKGGSRNIAASELDSIDGEENAEDASSQMEWSNNLNLIEGVDEDVAALLKSHGINSFQTIADFDADDVALLGGWLQDASRASREGWIEQAAMLSRDVSTRYALDFIGDDSFDRLSYNDAYEWSGPEFVEEAEALAEEKVIEKAAFVPVFTITSASEDEQVEDAVSQGEAQDYGALSDERDVLEAELAKLKLQLAAHSGFESVVDGMQDTVPDDEASEDRLARIFGDTDTEATFGEGSEQDDLDESSDVTDQSSENFDQEEFEQRLEARLSEAQDKLAAQADGDSDDGVPVGGVMWHEEVSTAADYVPPIVDDEPLMETADIFKASEEINEQSDGVAFEEIDVAGELYVPSDVAVPKTPQQSQTVYSKAADGASGEGSVPQQDAAGDEQGNARDIALPRQQAVNVQYVMPPVSPQVWSVDLPKAPVLQDGQHSQVPLQNGRFPPQQNGGIPMRFAGPPPLPPVNDHEASRLNGNVMNKNGHVNGSSSEVAENELGDYLARKRGQTGDIQSAVADQGMAPQVVPVNEIPVNLMTANGGIPISPEGALPRGGPRGMAIPVQGMTQVGMPPMGMPPRGNLGQNVVQNNGHHGVRPQQPLGAGHFDGENSVHHANMDRSRDKNQESDEHGVPDGFRNRAKKFAESLQNSFVEKDEKS